LSLSHPENILSRLAVLSAIPSITPMRLVPTPSTDDRKIGTSE